MTRSTSTGPTTPYGVVSAAERVASAEKHALVVVTRELEREALLDPPADAAATLQDQRYLTPSTRQVYRDLAGRGTRVRLYARGLQAWLAPGVSGTHLDDEDPLVDEWTVVLPGPRRPVVFAATDCRSEGVEDMRRTFTWAVSRDPEVVLAAAELLGAVPLPAAAEGLARGNRGGRHEVQ